MLPELEHKLSYEFLLIFMSAILDDSDFFPTATIFGSVFVLQAVNKLLGF